MPRRNKQRKEAKVIAEYFATGLVGHQTLSLLPDQQQQQMSKLIKAAVSDQQHQGPNLTN